MNNLFTVQEYRQFLQRYSALKNSEKIHEFLGQIEPLCHEYRSRLPTYLLARCPICGGRVHEPIDIFSLNGIGWHTPNRGFGWFGIVPVASSEGTRPQDDVSYDAECSHVEIVSVMFNLNGIQPNNVTQEVWIGSERPFVMSPILDLERTFAVIRSIPVGRYDDLEPQSHYTAYFVSYFTDNDSNVFDNVMQPAYEAYGRILYDWADYGLMKWVRRGKLYWLDKNDPDLPLRNRPIDDFPYGAVKGGEGIWVIRNGRMELRYGKSRQWSGGEVEPEWDTEGGFLRQIVSAFRAGWRDLK